MVEVNNDISAASTAPAVMPLQGYGRKTAVSEETLSNIVSVLDAVIIAVVGIAVYEVYLEGFMSDKAHDTVAYFATVAIALLVAVQRFSAARLYTLESLRNVKLQLKGMMIAWTSVIIVFVVAAYLLKISEAFSRGWVIMWYVGSAGLLSLSRFIVAERLKTWANAGHYFRAVAVVGAGPLGQRFVAAIHAQPSLGLRVIGLFDDRRSRVPGVVEGVPVIGSTSDLINNVRYGEVDLVVIAMPLSAEQRVLELMKQLRPLPIDVRLLSDAIGFNLANKSVSYWAGIPALNIADKPITGWNFIIKRLSDIVLSLIAMTVLAVPLAIIALLVKLDSPGPVLFRQPRYGFNHNLFSIYKFRSLRVEATDAAADRLVSRGDTRVTRFGRFIRRTSIDELPQLWNVLKGDMSLVGPRPHPVNAKAADKLYDEAVAEYAERHRVKPGITGWAQVNGWRGETDTLEKIEQRVAHDLYYIDHWSLLLDFWILFLTVFKIVTGKNAY